jgi:DNA-binding NarL/FixJ family response regulator
MRNRPRTTEEAIRDVETMLDLMRALHAKGWPFYEMRRRFSPLYVPRSGAIEKARRMLSETESGLIAPYSPAPTNTQIARECGLSIKTVEMAMSGRRRVSEASMLKVVETYRRLANA